MLSSGTGIEIGTRLEVRGGSATLDECLNHGALADVYRASFDATRQRLALKVANTSRGPEALAVHERERGALVALTRARAAGIPSLIDEGVLNGRPYLALPLVEGFTLRHVLARSRQLDAGAACAVGIQVLRALACVHDTGLVHCDLKPSNVMLAPTRYSFDTWLIDFGIAQPLRQPQRGPVPMLRGTPHYMSPEQLLCADVGAGTDLFALGVVLYECLAGARPFPCHDMQSAIRAKLSDEVLPADVAAPGCPRRLADFVQHLLARDPRDRPPDARSALAELERIARGVGLQPLRLSSFPPPVLVTTETSTVSTVVTWTMS